MFGITKSNTTFVQDKMIRNMTTELNNTNCKEYSDLELATILNIESLESLTKKYKKNLSSAKKVEYKSEAYLTIVKEALEIKTTILELYGHDSLMDVMLGKTRTDGKFKSLNSKGNGYGNY